MTPMNRTRVRPAIRVAVAAPFPEIVGIHQSAAEYADELEVCAMISDPEAVLDHARLLQPDVLLLSEGLGPGRADTLARLASVAPGTRLVMLVASPAGAAPVIADAVVRLGAPAAELREAIVAVVGGNRAETAPPAHARDVGSDVTSVAETAGPPPWLRVAATAGAATEPEAVPVFALPAQPGPVAGASLQRDPPPADDEAAAGAERAAARTVLVFSGKGGVGKSVVATNLATALAAGGARVALVDLNLQYGDVGVLLHLEAHSISIDAVAQHGDDIGGDVLEDALATSADGVRVLLAPSSPELSDLVSPAALEAILSQLTRRFDYVVVDLPPHLEERIVGVMEVADQILLVSSYGITSVKDTKVTLRLLQSLGVERERVALVLNQTRPRSTFPADEVERALRFPVLSHLPYEPRMDESVDSGRPLVAGEPRSGFSRQLALVVDHVARERGAGAGTKVRRHAAGWRLRMRH